MTESTLELCRFCGETDDIASSDDHTTCLRCGASAPDKVWQCGGGLATELLELLSGSFGAGFPTDMLEHVIDTLKENGYTVNDSGVRWRGPVVKQDQEDFWLSKVKEILDGKL